MIEMTQELERVAQEREMEEENKFSRSYLLLGTIFALKRSFRRERFVMEKGDIHEDI